MFALRGGLVVSKMLTYVYIASMGHFENVYLNNDKKCEFFTFLHENFGAFL